MARDFIRKQLNWLNGIRANNLGASMSGKLSVTVAGVVVLLCAGLLFNRFVHRDFIGKQTRLIHECKRNPHIDPVKCAELLSARGSTPRVNESGFRDPTLRKGFGLIPDDELKQHRGTPRR
jgi:hypothetical protein